MRALLVVAVLSHAALAQPCPFDAKVRALADDPTALSVVSKALEAHFKASLAASRKACDRVETHLRVRTLEASRRCATALVELVVAEADCHEISIVTGAPDYVPSHFAMVAADAKGRLGVVWVLEGARDPLPPPPDAGVSFHGECAASIDRGETATLRSIVRLPELHFDGCALRGVPEALVRTEVLAALERDESPNVTCRFFEGDAPHPRCAASTRVTDAGVAVVFAGGFVPDLYPADSPHFEPAGAYFEPGDGGAQWLCNDLRLDQGTPLTPPPAAREGCTPARAKQGLLRRASEEATPAAVESVWRRAINLPTSSPPGASIPVEASAPLKLKVERLVLERGRGILNEGTLAARLREGVEAFARCSREWGVLEGAAGSIYTSPGGGARLALDRPLDDERCVATLREALASFGLRHPHNAGMSTYRFRLSRSD
jgi:hypothetical protein